MERMRDNDKTQIVTARPVTMPPPSALRAPAPRCLPPWVSPPPSPAAGSTCPTTTGSRSCTDSGRRSTSNASIDSSSTPAAPLFALTLSNASQTTHFEMSNGLSDNFGSLTRLLPTPTSVDHRTHPGDPSPSLRPHYRASPLLRDGPPLCPASVLHPSQFPLLGALPSTDRSNTRPAPPGRQVPTFRADARSELAPPLRRSPPGQSAGTRQARPRATTGPRFR